MAINYPGPYELRINYETDGTPGGVYEHQLRLSCILASDPTPGDLFADIDIVPRVAASTNLASVTDELIILLKPFFSAADATFVNAELWKYAALSFDASYISSYAIAVAGTAGTSTTPGQQTIFSFRTFGGGKFFVHLLETVGVPAVSENYADMDAAEKALADWFTDDADSWFVARDNTYPLLVLKLHPGQNEALFKKRFR